MSQAEVSRKLEAFLQQCTHFDKDQRYMAVSDMSNILLQNVRLDSALEKRIGDCLCKLFDDKSVDVQSIAVKTVSILVGSKTCQERTVVDVFAFLGKKMLTGDDVAIRSLYAIGLKTCITSLVSVGGGAGDDAASATLQLVFAKLVPSLVTFCQQDQATADVQDALEVLGDLLNKSKTVAGGGAGMERFHGEMIAMAVQQLSHNGNALVRKRAISLLASLAQLCSDQALTKMIEDVMRIGGIETVLAIGAIGREAGSRLAHYVDKLVPLLVQSLKPVQDESMQTAQGDEHRECIFQALESFLVRCPAEMDKHLDSLLRDQCFVFLKYDPNWNDDDDDEDDNMSDVEGDEGGDEGYSDGGYSDGGAGGDDDDDDTAWKVRRACAKLLHSLVSTKSDKVVLVYFAQLEQLLVERSCKERVESVRLDVLDAYKSLLDCAAASASVAATTTTGGRGASSTATAAHNVLQRSLPTLARSLTKLLKQSTQPKSKIAILQVLNKAISLLGGGGSSGGVEAAHVDALLPLLLVNVKDRNANLKLESLLMCKALVVSLKGSSALTAQHVKQIKPAVLVCIDADWFKIVSEALKSVSALCSSSSSAQPLLSKEDGQQLLSSVLPRLRQADIDQEIKNCAIDAAGHILAAFPSSASAVSEPEKQALGILLERTKNESSRLAALRAFERIASSSQRANTPAEFPVLSGELAALLRQQSRDVRQHALSCLLAMVRGGGGAQFVPPNLPALLGEAAQIVGEARDAHLCHLALDFATAVVRLPAATGGARDAVKSTVLPSVVQLCTAGTTLGALGSGPAYVSLLQLFATLAQTCASPAEFSALYSSLLVNSTDAAQTKIQLVAEACAVLVVESQEYKAKNVANAVAAATGGATSLYLRHVHLVLLGEIGRRTSLAQHQQSVSAVLLQAFDGDKEDEPLRVSAAASLGKLVLGDAAAFLPVVMSLLQQSHALPAHKQYLVLVSLKEILSSPALLLSTTGNDANLATITQVLGNQLAACPVDEEVRSMLGECLGKLASLQPQVVAQLLVPSAADSAAAAWTKITAVRYAIVSAASSQQAQAAQQQLAQHFVACVGPFLATAQLDGTKREQTDNCKAALFACHTLIHHLPAVAADVLDKPIIGSTATASSSIMDLLYEATKVVPGLQKKVDFGPFKILVDDGLPLRKSAFSCLSSLLDTHYATTGKLLGALNTSPLLPCCAQGVVDFPEDAPDVAVICHQILIQVCHRSPLAILAHSQQVLKALQDTFTKIKYSAPATAAASSSSSSGSAAAANKDEDPEGRERKLSIFRSALRAINAIALVPGALEDRAVADCVAVVQKQDFLYKLVQEEGFKALLVRKQ